MNNKTKLRLASTGITLVSILLILFFYYKDQGHLTIYPDKSLDVILKSDRDLGGDTEISEFRHDDNGISLSYTMKPGYTYPYFAIAIGHKDKSYFDLSAFNEVELELYSTSAIHYRLLLLTEVDSIRKANDFYTFLYTEFEIQEKEKDNHYSFAISDGVIPHWWYNYNKISKEDSSITPDFSKTVYIAVMNEVIRRMHEPDSIIIKSITFKKSKIYYKISLTILISLFIFLLLFPFYLKRLAKYPSQKPSHPDYIEDSSPHTVMLCNYIHKHYSNKTLSVKTVAEKTGIAPHKIPLLIHDAMQLSFPQYLNSIRIEKAKELLCTTSDKIVEIADTVGYSSVEHFNRIFKRCEGLTPLQYRKINS